jgi:nucleobase:cation symporter-1, NCS1 family
MATTKSSETEAARALQIEEKSIHYIDPSERHGRVRDQFTMWFGANTCALALVFGGLAISFGLSLGWAIVAILVGTAIGAAVAAFHALQGPQLGVPQLVQCRGQFGFYGATIFFLATYLLQFGYMAAQLVVQGYLLNTAFPAVSIPVWILICAVPTVILAIFGYNLVHAWQRYITIVVAIMVLIIAIQSVAFSSGHHQGAAFASPSVATFMTVISLFFIAAASWSPNVSDYSRYLPEDVSFRRTFSAIFFGIFLGWAAIACIGSLVVWQIPTGSLYAAIQTITGKWALVLLAISLISTNTVNTYTGMLSVVSTISTFRRVPVGQAIRILGIGLMVAAALIAAIAGYNSFLNSLENFLDVLIFVFVPWSAINLLDFYFVRKGHYDIDSFFTPKGVYGGWQMKAIICYLIGLAVEFPFLNQTFYEGPFAKLLNGVDISWIVGFIVPFFLYLFVARIGGSNALRPAQAAVPGGVDPAGRH